jgi:hypothetical protein
MTWTRFSARTSLARTSASCRIASRRAFARYVTYTILPACRSRRTRRRPGSQPGGLGKEALAKSGKVPVNAQYRRSERAYGGNPKIPGLGPPSGPAPALG